MLADKADLAPRCRRRLTAQIGARESHGAVWSYPRLAHPTGCAQPGQDMRFSGHPSGAAATIPAPLILIAIVRLGRAGYTHAWFYDTELLNAEVFVAMGTAAMKTLKIKLCAGVLIPSDRIAPVAASGLASLNALAPGRVVFGASTGYTARRTLGLGPVTLARLEKYVQVVEGLLAGKTVEWDEEGGTHKMRFLNPELELINIKDPIPTFISAFGPKARRMTAFSALGGSEAPATPSARRPIPTTCRRPGASRATIPRTSTPRLEQAAACSTRASRPTARARGRRPYAAIAFHNLVEQDQFGSVFPVGPHFPFQAQLDAYGEVYETYEPADARYLTNHRGHLMFVRPEETHLTADAIRGMTLTGTRGELAERLKGIKALGYKQIQFHTVPGQENDMLERWAEVMAKV